jgi:hypothetical protein
MLIDGCQKVIFSAYILINRRGKFLAQLNAKKRARVGKGKLFAGLPGAASNQLHHRSHRLDSPFLPYTLQ